MRVGGNLVMVDGDLVSVDGGFDEGGWGGW